MNIGEYTPRLRLVEYSPIFIHLRWIIVKCIQQMIGVLAAQNNLEVKNAR